MVQVRFSTLLVWGGIAYNSFVYFSFNFNSSLTLLCLNIKGFLKNYGLRPKGKFILS